MCVWARLMAGYLWGTAYSSVKSRYHPSQRHRSHFTVYYGYGKVTVISYRRKLRFLRLNPKDYFDTICEPKSDTFSKNRRGAPRQSCQQFETSDFRASSGIMSPRRTHHDRQCNITNDSWMAGGTGKAARHCKAEARLVAFREHGHPSEPSSPFTDTPMLSMGNSSDIPQGTGFALPRAAG